MQHGIRGCEADHDGFNGQQAAGLQGIALERHGQGENELGQQQPACRHRPQGQGHQGVDQQEGNDGVLIPGGGLPQEILNKGAA